MSSAMIDIVLNGESRKVEKEVSLDRLLDLFSLPRQRVAVELNRSVVRRGDWLDTQVRDGDTIEVIHFVGGG
jgi:sulfur carrier protein